MTTASINTQAHLHLLLGAQHLFVHSVEKDGFARENIFAGVRKMLKLNSERTMPGNLTLIVMRGDYFAGAVSIEDQTPSELTLQIHAFLTNRYRHD